MMSRTCARQQRMRQQILNEERMSHTEDPIRPPGERRSSGSKLIISSPTPTAYPFLNHNQPQSQSTPLAEANSRVPTQPTPRGAGASALLAFLSGSDQRHSTPTTTSTGAPQTLQQQQQQQQANQMESNAKVVIPQHQLLPTLSSPSPRRGATAADTGITTTALPLSVPGTDNAQLMYQGVGKDRSAKSHDHLEPHQQSQESSSKSHGRRTATTQDSDVRNTSTGPVDISTMDLESTVSPVSSDLNSPMESCFPNIAEDQEGDSFDLNNITPSIHLSSSFGVPGELLTGYPRPNSIALDMAGGDRGTRFPSCNAVASAHPRLGIRVAHLSPDTTTTTATTTNNSHHHHHHPHNHTLHNHNHPRTINNMRPVVSKADEDELSLVKASTSCPAEMQGSHQALGTSPAQLATSFGLSHTTGGTSGGSGASLGGNSTTDGGGGSMSSNLLYASPGSIPRNCDDPRAAWVRDRSKKDSHNRIERKRRDYINCQISELGNLLPEDMFRDGDCKKNKGSILKNSVEFICLLRSELAQVPDVRKETILAAKVIGQLTKRIQELETISGATQGNLDYQRTLQEWLLLHEHNLQNRTTTVSPGAIRSSYMHRSDAGAPGSSSPGLSSIGTEELLTADTKSVFSSPGLLAGSAPAPSAPLANCSRLHSPVSCSPNNSRLSGALDSPLRMMRTRCTSLTVAGPSSIGNPLDPPPGIRLHTTPELHSQQQQQTTPPTHVLLQQPQQRLVSGQPLRGVPSTLHPPNTQSQLRVSSLLQMHTRPWQSQQQQQQQTDSTGVNRLPSQLSPQHMVSQHRRSHVTRPIELLQVSTDHDMLACSGLSASLPANVNPLLCGLPDRDERKISDTGLHHVYSFERDDFLTHLKTEPLSEAGSSRASEVGYPEPGRSSAELGYTDPGLTQSTDMNSVNRGPGQTAQAHTGTRNLNYVSEMALDSPNQLAFEADDFHFDDVPME